MTLKALKAACKVSFMAYQIKKRPKALGGLPEEDGQLRIGGRSGKSEDGSPLKGGRYLLAGRLARIVFSFDRLLATYTPGIASSQLVLFNERVFSNTQWPPHVSGI